MQRVIKTVYTNLCDLKLAIDGTIVMSQNLKDSLDAMYDARIPERWQKVMTHEIDIHVSLPMLTYGEEEISLLLLTIVNIFGKHVLKRHRFLGCGLFLLGTETSEADM